jgi:hypothetical protein
LFPVKRIVVFYGIIFLFLIRCGGKTREKEDSLNSDTASINESLVRNTVEPIQYTQYLFDRSGALLDSFPHGTSWIKYLNIGKKQPFPDGFAALQQPLNDTIHRVCELECELCEDFYRSDEGDTNECLKKGVFIEQFKPTDGESYFNSINYLNYYFFLAQVDSCFISLEDTEYAFLHFMKLKTKRYGLEHIVKVVKEDWINVCENEKIKWKKPVPVFMMEKGKVYTTSFDQWEEIWDCGEKADYAPKYAFTALKQVKGIFKSYAYYDSPLNSLDDPYFIFSYVVMDETKNKLKDIKATAYPMQLVTTKGEIRKGMGIDLNKDKHADVFWYNRKYMKGYPVEKRNTVLYIKIKNDWTPVYIHNFSQFY